MREPGPNHTISIAPNPKRIRVLVGGVIVAETTRAQTLSEGKLAPVHYIPREDVESDLFDRTEQTSHCPFKGDAAYYTISAGGLVRPNAAWVYEDPYPAAAAIKGHLAFYPNRVDAIEELNG